MLETESTFGTTEIYCDGKGCNAESRHEAPIDNYPDIKAACDEAKQDGWIICTEDGEWYHYCSKECKEKD